jgi:signal transduction histidine kinase
LRHVLEAGEAILIRDVTASELMQSVRDLMRHSATVSLTAVPLRLPDLTAILRITSTSRSLSPADLEVLRAAAHCIEAELHHAVADRSDEESWSTLALGLADVVLEVAADGRIVSVHGEPDSALASGMGQLKGRPLADALTDPDPETLVALLRGTGTGHRLTVQTPASPLTRAVAMAAPCRVPPLRVRIALREVDDVSPPIEPASADADVLPEGTLDREARLQSQLRQQIDELGRLRRRVDELAARRTLFLSASAHELKTPLTVLQVYLETLRGDLCDGMTEEQLEFLGICHESVLRLRRLVIDLVDLAALESGDIELAIDRVEMAPVLTAVLEDVEPLARHSGVELVMDCPDDIPPARADPSRVQQVARNLVHNAIKHTPADGAVSVRCRAEDDGLVLTVEDNGSGIPADQLDDIFQEYLQVGPAENRRDHGSGLGLAVSRRLVAALGGRITASSCEGQGSVFTVYLPQWPDH